MYTPSLHFAGQRFKLTNAQPQHDARFKDRVLGLTTRITEQHHVQAKMTFPNEFHFINPGNPFQPESDQFMGTPSAIVEFIEPDGGPVPMRATPEITNVPNADRILRAEAAYFEAFQSQVKGIQIEKIQD